MANQMHFYKTITDDEIVITEPKQTFDGHFIPLLRHWDKKEKKKSAVIFRQIVLTLITVSLLFI